ncbi:hypothetical protein [Roseospirillum parvum]|uniref:Uncharacterized protein n=1 Tax=Roseospirillum parvum TaxID=83401 RepID=A0A1G8FMB1_9PROT|nr:hypothetical protein [Roseospirillum parvum]SDH83237.1 hypothetical protein SAMN05421742_1157 [Roseospirillum parvum]
MTPHHHPPSSRAARRLALAPLAMLAGALLLALALALPGPARAADAEGRLNALVGELQRLIDKAERERLADPWFLKDLRQVVAAHTNPWPRVLLDDGFTDGNYDRRPAWRVLSGEWAAGWNGGLRSRFTPPRAASPSRQTPDDPTAAIVGTLLGQMLAQQQGGGSGAAQAAGPADRAAIETRLALPNSFALDLELTAAPDRAATRLALGPFQGERADTGYRLVLSSAGGGGSVELLRLSARGSSVIDGVDGLVPLADGEVHRVRWERRPDATMRVLIDGREVLATRDRGFRDPFDGLVLENHGGDVTIGRVVVNGPA